MKNDLLNLKAKIDAGAEYIVTQMFFDNKKYIEFVNRDENIDFDEKMQNLQTEFADLLKAEAQSKNDLLTVFKQLGYEIKL